MKKYEEQKFNISELAGISKKSIEEHLKLYAGYVKHFNLVHEVVENLDNPDFARRETYRRQAFEFDGIRNHEYYFAALEGGSKPLPQDSTLSKKLKEWNRTVEDVIEIFKKLTTTRGIGWAMLGYDKKTDQLIQYWVDEQHFGHLTGVRPILALDLWEHSYLFDYIPSEKAKYVEAYLANVNWEIIEENFKEASK